MSSLGQLDRKTIVINSAFRDSGTPSSFQWKFSERVENIRYADLRMFTVENGLYNVDSTNNKFFLSENFVLPSGWTFLETQVVIPTGYYDDTTFASTLGLAMSQASRTNAGNLYLVQILNSGLLQITSSSASVISDGTFAIGFTNAVATSYPLTAELLGFVSLTPNAYNSIISGLYQTIISDDPTALVIYDYLLVNSQKLGNDVSFYSGKYINTTLIGTDTPIRPNPSSCWAVVPNNQPSRDNNVLIWENVRPPQIATLKYPFSLDYVDINILDKLGRNVDLSGQSVSLVVELYTDKKGQDVSTTHHSY